MGYTPAVQAALNYAAKGWYVFPILPNAKLPFKDFKWKEHSTCDIAAIKRAVMMPKFKECNWALDCEKSGVFVLDVDKHAGADGAETLKEVQQEPIETFTVETPSGGLHHYFLGIGPSTVGKLGPGLDTRGTGGYVLIPGSSIDSKPYLVINQKAEIAFIPSSIAEKLRSINQEKRSDRKLAITELDQESNIVLAISYLVNDAPEATEGQQGDLATYKIACRLRDLGISPEKSLELLLQYWNDQKANPPWNPEDLNRKILSAENSAKDRAGNATPEAMFPDGAIIEASGNIRSAADIVPSEIPPRRWLLGYRYLAGYITLTIAPGGVGKSLLTILEGLSMVTGRQLTYDPVHEPGPVWLYNAEDPFDELERRIIATAMHYEIPQDELTHFYYSSGYDKPMIMARYDDNRRVSVNQRLLDTIGDRIVQRNIKLFIIDPLISIHELTENDNPGMNQLMMGFRRLGAETGCAISQAHHANKGMDAASRGNAEKSRGATSLIASARIAHTIYPMSAKEAALYGLNKNDAPWYVRLDSAKSNLGPPSSGADLWFKKKSIKLFPEDGESTGVLEIADNMITNTHADVPGPDNDDAIRLSVFQLVSLDRPESTHNLAKIITDVGTIDQSAKTVQRRIEQLFAFPVFEGNYSYIVALIKGDSGKETNHITCELG